MSSLNFNKNMSSDSTSTVPKNKNDLQFCTIDYDLFLEMALQVYHNLAKDKYDKTEIM